MRALLLLCILVSCQKSNLNNVETVKIVANDKGESCIATKLADGLYISAAHCVEKDYKSLKLAGVERKNYQIIIHPKWDHKTVSFDVALILLEGKKDRSVLEVKLADFSLANGDLISRLKSNGVVDYFTVVASQAEKVFSTYTYKPRSSCLGDSGAPNFLFNSQKPTLVAITSGVIGELKNGCLVEGGVSSAMNIVKFKNWILKYI